MAYKSQPSVIQHLPNLNTTSNLYYINIGLTGPDGVQATIISYNCLSNSKTTSNSCCINLGHTGPDGVQVTIISNNIYRTLEQLVTHVALTRA